MQVLPELSIASCLQNSETDITIAYINSEDIAELPKSDRLSFLHIGSIPECEELVKGMRPSEYFDFNELNFYKLVCLKWYVLSYLLSEGYDLITYSDTDVIWFSDPIKKIRELFESSSRFKIAIQDSTMTIGDTRLCMGFITLLKSPETIDMIEKCRTINEQMLLVNPNYGDDDAVTQWYSENNYPDWVYLLQQNIFPLGYSLDLYSKKSKYPNLHRINPEIFHLNFVVGIKKKIMLAYVLKKYSTLKINFNFPSKVWLLLHFYRIRGFAGKYWRNYKKIMKV